jgi:aquaporin Z
MLANIEKSSTILFIQKLIAEACGTFALVFSVGVTQGDPTSVAPALWAAMLGTGYISGGQFNPAVSIAVIVNAFLSKSEDLLKTVLTMLCFITVQMITSLFAADMAYHVVNSNDWRVAYFDLADGYKESEGFLAEAFFTAILTGVAIIGGKLTKSSILHGGLVATTVSAGDFAVGQYTGGCFNPAVGFGINVIHKIVKGGGYHKVWLYIVAPGVGGIIGGTFATFFIKFGVEQQVLKKVQY